MVTAKARTNEFGVSISSLGEDIHASKIPLWARKKDPWKVDIKLTQKGKLANLLSSDKFGLLANYLLDQEKYSPLTNIKYGKAGTIREIKIEGKRYRSNAYTIISERN